MNLSDSTNSSHTQAIGRIQKLTALIAGTKTIDRVEVMEIHLPAYQQVGRHLHPCPVIGCVTAGTILFQIEGQPSHLLKASDVFFEPANTPIRHFDNPAAEPATFIAYYLLGSDDRELITMLPVARD
jgi:quercetin dioxygenase-like cupin family protein